MLNVIKRRTVFLLSLRKILPIVKLTTAMLVLCCMSISASIYSNHTKLSLSIRDKSIKEILFEIENLSEFRFIYESEKINFDKKVSVDLEEQTIHSVLNHIFRAEEVEYQITDNNLILIHPVKKNESVSSVSQGVTQIKKTVSGIVTGDLGEAVIGANVIEKGTTNGVITDIEGRFTLQVAENAVLQFSYIGYVTQEVRVNNTTYFTIQLREDTQSLEEVVVVGYGTQKKINLTGAVEVIGGEKLENRPVPTLSQALQGQVGGANFTAGEFGYEPGAALSFQIRGQGDAYILVDGVPTDLSRINPNDIESISVLKDAAAASIYGALASYGVVLITTKSGKKDSKPSIHFTSNLSAKKLHRKPRMVDSYTFARMMNEAGENGGGRVFNEETIDRIIAYQKDPSLPETIQSTVTPGTWATEQYSNANYDWFDEYYGTGWNNQENISIRGGSKVVNYYVSAGHVYDSGILNYGTDTYRRINTMAKMDITLTDWWELSLNTRFQKARRERPNFDNQGDYGLLFHQVARTFPNQVKMTPNGYYTRLSKIPWTQDAGTDETVDYETIQRFATRIKPLKGWSIDADYTFKLYNNRFTSNNFTVYEDLVDGTLVPLGTTVPSYMEKSQRNDFYTSLNVYTTYEFTLNDSHNIRVMAGLQQEQERSDKLQGRKNDIVTPKVPSISTSTGDIHSLTDEVTHWSRFGTFYRAEYNYKEKYLFEANCRYDGTSVFARGNRWGFFPSFSGGWNISREGFFENLLDKVNNLKLRVSWGSLGNQNVAAYQDIALLNIQSNLDWLINGARPIYVETPNLINQHLTWETSETLDLGLDIGLFNNRLNVTADWYQRRTRNQLGPAEALPAVIGAEIPRMNNAELKTNGWELMLSWRDRINKDFSYWATAMVWDYYSEVTQYNNPTKILTTAYVGQRVGEIWGYETEGLIQTEEEAKWIMDTGYQNQFNTVWNTGDVKYKDLDGSGSVDNGSNTKDDHGDLRVIGNTTPRYQFSLNVGATYKGFDFSMLWQGTAKRDLWIESNMFWGFQTWNQSSLFADDHLDYYRDAVADTYVGLGVNTNAYFPRPYLVGASNRKNREVQTRYLQNGAYMRLKNVQLAYTLPANVTNKLSLSRVRVYFSGDNLLTFTGRFPKSMDPETAIIGGWGHGKSMNAQTAYSFGLEIEF